MKWNNALRLVKDSEVTLFCIVSRNIFWKEVFYYAYYLFHFIYTHMAYIWWGPLLRPIWLAYRQSWGYITQLFESPHTALIAWRFFSLPSMSWQRTHILIASRVFSNHSLVERFTISFSSRSALNLQPLDHWMSVIAHSNRRCSI